MESTTSGRGCKLKFLQAKRVQFILDFLDLFTKNDERILLLQRLSKRYCLEISDLIEQQRNDFKEIEEKCEKHREQLKWIDKEIKKQKRRLREFEEERDND